MSHGERFFIRVLGHAAYGIAGSAALIFSFSDIPWLRSLGMLIVLFILDSVFHIGKGDVSLRQFWHHGSHARGSMNAHDYSTPYALRSLEIALEQSTMAPPGSFILLLAARLAENKRVMQGLLRMGIDLAAFIAKTNTFIEQAPERGWVPAEREIALIMIAATRHAIAYRRLYVEPEDIFASLSVSEDNRVQKLLSSFTIHGDDLENSLLLARRSREAHRFHIRRLLGEPRRVSHKVMNRAWTARPTPILDSVSDDMTDRARAGAVGLLVGHHKEAGELIDVLTKEGRRNALLVGEVGSGKSAIAHHLALLMTEDRVPSELLDKRLVRLSLARLLAGAGPGELEERLRVIMREIRSSGNIVFYIPDIHLLSRSGNSLSVAEFILPLIADESISVIGATTPQEFRVNIERVSEFAESFETIRIQEITPEEAAIILAWRAPLIESNEHVKVGYRAIQEAVKLAKRYFRNRLLPGSAEELLSEAAAYAVGRGEKIVSGESVVAVAERKSNIPIHEAERHESDKLLHLEEEMKLKIIGQTEAVHALARVMREYRAGLTRRGGPIASFLFVGPTGVGKTELAKVLAEMQFGSERQMIRFDMSEYQTLQSVAKFIGSGEGVTTGTLVDAVREKPYSLILLDEFEKAHPNILNIFLQVLDDGRLTDTAGRVASFEDTVVIATSNAHSDFIQEKIQNQASYTEIAVELKTRLSTLFRVELLNRFSDIIMFRPLSREDVLAIAKLQLEELTRMLRDEHEITFHYTDEVLQEMARLGYSPSLGARPLKRAISERLRSPLADIMLRGTLERGGTILAEMKNGEIVLGAR